MNLLARILSHGCGFIVVALIILVLVYRGDLFEEWYMPDFLALKDKPVASVDTGAGEVDRAPAALTGRGEDAATAVAPEPEPEPEPLAPGVAEEAGMPPAVGTAPADVSETAAEAVADTPVDTEPATPAPEDAAVLESAPPETVTAPVDTEPAAPVATEDAEDTAPQEEGDDSAEPAPAADESAQPAHEAVIEESHDAASTGASATTEVADEQPAEAGSAATTTEPPVAAPAATATPDTSATATTTAEVVDDQPAEEQPAGVTSAVPAADAPAATAAADVPTTDAADTQAAPADVEPAATGTDSRAADSGETETPYNVLAKAREAYWLRDFAMAEQQYKKLTRLEPENPDGYGELGNMYFSRGMWDEAANAYYEAGVRLLDEGLIVQAGQMVDVIRGLNGSQADELDALINAAKTSP